VFHAGTSAIDGVLITSGGRVLSVTAEGDTLVQARELALAATAMISIDGSHYRGDIAQLAAQGGISIT